MYRDFDRREGEDGRTVIEHVYFKNPDKIINKTIGMCVHNYSNKTNLNRNDFKLCIFNRYAY